MFVIDKKEEKLVTGNFLSFLINYQKPEDLFNDYNFSQLFFF